jgi:hypothetical protein
MVVGKERWVQSIVIFISLLVVESPFAFLIGGAEALFLTGVSTGAAIIVFWIFYGLYSYVSSLWRKFNKENPTEEDQIVNILRGYEAND